MFVFLSGYFIVIFSCIFFALSCQLKEEALDRTMWRNRFERGLDLSFDRLLMMMSRRVHILRRNCLLQQVIEGKIKGQIEVTRRLGRRRKKLLDDLKDRRGYCQLKEEALDRTVWRNRFGRGFGPVV